MLDLGTVAANDISNISMEWFCSVNEQDFRGSIRYSGMKNATKDSITINEKKKLLRFTTEDNFSNKNITIIETVAPLQA
jgi:hypothetical protein